ncbi:MAG: HDOD domain-containing protein [Planctomycetes bacterium]|nr:HDOD domain-containing protein [Planctomycetota bacterium]
MSAALSGGKLESILGELRKLPLMPVTAQQAVNLANQEGADLQEFARLVERDITLATSFLKLAHSPMYSWGRTIDSVEQAVVRLGLRDCQNVLLAVAMRNLFHTTAPTTKAHCAVLWQHCFLTACFSRRLNKEFGFDYRGEEFTAGLLHDLGRILLAVTIPDNFCAADPIDFIEDDSILDRERSVLDADHCQVGGHYAEQNQLPFAALAAIRFHHRLDDAKDHRGIVRLVVMSDHLANFVQRGAKPEAYDLAANLGFQAIATGWSGEKIEAFRGKIPGLIEETARAANQSVSSPKASSGEPKRSKPQAVQEPPASLWDSVRGWLGR